MISIDSWPRPAMLALNSALGILALLAILACGDSAGELSPTATPPSIQFATPPGATSTSADDRSGSDLDIQLDGTPTPYPTATLIPLQLHIPPPRRFPWTLTRTDRRRINRLPKIQQNLLHPGQQPAIVDTEQDRLGTSQGGFKPQRYRLNGRGRRNLGRRGRR